jgi:AraC family L-rhamnose operon regulatory protein RhaS
MVIRMTDELLVELKKITPEEESILAGRAEIEKDIYMSEGHDTVEAKRLLDDGKLIQVRTHTRFVHFPRHTHNYIEVIYMCSGSTHHVIDGKDVFLQEGEVLLLNQKAVQEIYPAGMDDVAVNFIVLPEFFDCGLKMMGEEKNLLRDFVIDCLKGENGAAGYIHFKVADILPIQNLLENLIWSIWHRQPNKRSINQITMGLLFLQLMNYTDRMETGFGNRQQGVMISVLGYVEEHYRDGELSKLARLLHYDLYWLSREIKKITGKNYTELVQEKRLNQAVYLLEHTTMSVMDIGMSVGYDNISYFHRIFQKRYGMTPRKYRVTKKVTVK